MKYKYEFSYDKAAIKAMEITLGQGGINTLMRQTVRQSKDKEDCVMSGTIINKEATEKKFEDYQVEQFGECLMTYDHMATIFESLADGNDIILKKYKDHLDILELRKKRISSPAHRARAYSTKMMEVPGTSL